MNATSIVNYLLETKLSYLLIPFMYLSSFYFKWNYSLLKDYKFFFSSMVGIFSIAIGFLITILFQLWTLNTSSIIDIFKKMNLLKKLKFYQYTSILSCILSLIFSILFPLYFDYSITDSNQFLTNIYNCSILYSLYCLLRFAYIFFKINNYVLHEKYSVPVYVEAQLPDESNATSNNKLDNIPDDN